MVHWYGPIPLETERSAEKGDLWLEEPNGDWYEWTGKEWRKYEGI